MKNIASNKARILRLVIISTATCTCGASAQTLNGAGGVNMGNTGRITNLPPITFPSQNPAVVSWEHPGLQGLALPAAQFTGITTTGGALHPLDLLPLQARSLGIIDRSGVPVVALSAGAQAGDPGWLQFRSPLTGQLEAVLSLDSSGKLAVRGSPVLTQASAISSGFVNDSNFNTKLAATTPPASPAWTSTYLLRGNVTPPAGQTIGGYFAMGRSTASGFYSTAAGEGVTASGAYSSASGAGTTTASGVYARASGYNSLASGTYSTANGNSATAAGFFSFSNGFGTSAKSSNEIAFGRYNLESAPLAGTLGVNGLDGLFRLGNGTSTARSDAMTVLKSGETTLTNKDWKAAVVSSPGNATIALANPPSTTDSNGNALVVDGHTVLNGKVIISVPQGDISMGIYE